MIGREGLGTFRVDWVMTPKPKLGTEDRGTTNRNVTLEKKRVFGPDIITEGTRHSGNVLSLLHTRVSSYHTQSVPVASRFPTVQGN